MIASYRAFVLVAGVVTRLQRPAADAYVISLEDETGLVLLIPWSSVYARYHSKLRDTFLFVSSPERCLKWVLGACPETFC